MIKAHEANDESSCINVHHFIETASNIKGGRKKQKQLTGNSHSTAFVFLDHAVTIGNLYTLCT